ncbi:MAG: hypothetical protein RQ724_00520 [Desulfuromonadales bacterium]|nr:hypothetical protein [Desulfuromonadales bacterium]
MRRGFICCMTLLLAFFLMGGIACGSLKYTGAGYAGLAADHLLSKFMAPQVSGGKVSGLFTVPVQLAQHPPEIVLTRILHPLFVGLAGCWRQLSIYLLYMFVTSAVLLAWSLWAGGHGGG